MAIVKSYHYDVTFEENSASIVERGAMNQIAGRCRGLADHRIRIVGYADSFREDDHLAVLRAEYLRDYLLNCAVPETRIDELGSCEVSGEDSDYPEQLRRVDVFCYNANYAPREWHQYSQWYARLRTIQLGDNRAGVEGILDELGACETSSIAKIFGLRFLREDRISTWMAPPRRIDHSNHVGYVIAEWSESGHLVDLILYDQYLGVLPLVRGRFCQQLASLSAGLEVEDLFERIGKRAPAHYYKDSRGRWMLAFQYRGVPPDRWSVIVNPRTALVMTQPILNLCN